MSENNSNELPPESPAGSESAKLEKVLDLSGDASEGKVVILDILSNLSIILTSSHAITSLPQLVSPVALSEQDLVIVKLIDRISPMFRSHYDVYNRRFYVTHNVESGPDFSTQEGYISCLITDFKNEMALSSTYMKEPKREVFENDRVFDPDTLGYDSNIFHFDSSADSIQRSVIEGLCRPLTALGRTRGHCLDYPPRAKCREEILSVIRSRSRPSIRPYEQVERIISCISGTPVKNFPVAAQHTYYYPNVPFSVELRGIFENTKFSSALRIAMASPLLVPKVHVSSIPSNLMSKAAKTSLTKVGFVNNFINKTYRVEMAQEISAWIYSLVFPGELICDIDFDDSEGQTELNGVLSLLCKALFMYDPTLGYTNISKRSVRTVEANIAKWLKSTGSVKSVTSDDYPLNAVESNGSSGNWIADIRTDCRGAGWMNAGIVPRPNQDELSQLFSGIHVRTNYVIDENDSRKFNHDMMNRSNIHDQIRQVIKHTKSGEWRGVIDAFLESQLKFFVSFNEYLTINWYTTLRSSHSSFVSKDSDLRESDAVHAVIRSDTLIYLVKSLGAQLIVPPHDVISRLRIEAAMFKELLDISMYNELCNRIINRFGNQDHYPTSMRLKMISSHCSSVFKWFIESLTLSNECDHFFRFLDFIVNTSHPYLELWLPIRNRSDGDMIPKGFVPRILYQMRFNWISPETIRSSIANNSLVTNEFIGTIPARMANDGIRSTSFLDLANIQSLVTRRSLKNLMFSSTNSPLVLNFPFSYKYNYSMSDCCGDKLIEYSSDGEFSIARSVRRGLVPIYSVSFDSNSFKYDDDYTPAPFNFCSLWIEPSIFQALVIPRDSFISQLGERSSTITLFPEPTLDLRSPFGNAV